MTYEQHILYDWYGAWKQPTEKRVKKDAELLDQFSKLKAKSMKHYVWFAWWHGDGDKGASTYPRTAKGLERMAKRLEKLA